LPAWLFKKCSFELADVVAKSLNMSFISGKVYSNWLIGIGTPVPKVVSPVTMNDFRPILVTPILSRLAEKLVVRHWLLPSVPLNHIEDQFAFLPSGITTSTLVSLIHHVASMLESNSFVRCLTIDFSKAFDAVNHEVLLQKVSTLHLPDNIHNWLVSFITDRQQKCKVNGSISSCSAITHSIIQGSGIGPAFYIIMNDDFKPLSVHNVMCKYADDINLLVPEHTDIDLKAEFNNVRQWTKVNKMILNLSKTKEIVFRRPCRKRDYLLPSLDDIEQVDHIRCLGIILHQGLNFELHVQSVLRQCSQRLYLLRMLRNQGIPPDKLHIIFRGIVVACTPWSIKKRATFIFSITLANIDGFS